MQTLYQPAAGRRRRARAALRGRRPAAVHRLQGAQGGRFARGNQRRSRRSTFSSSHKLKNLADYEASAGQERFDGRAVPARQKARLHRRGASPPSRGRKSAAPACRPTRWSIPARASSRRPPPTSTPCYDDYCEARAHIAASKKHRKKIIVLGSGPIRIGQGIEFDYSSVHCVADAPASWATRSSSSTTTPRRCPPTSMSADRLYFEPLTKEDVMERHRGRKAHRRRRRLRRADGHQAGQVPRRQGHPHPRHLGRGHRHRRGPRAVRQAAEQVPHQAPEGTGRHDDGAGAQAPPKASATPCCCGRPTSSAGRT